MHSKSSFPIDSPFALSFFWPFPFPFSRSFTSARFSNDYEALARSRAREREREKHTAGGHKSRFAIAGHWKRLMKPLWAKNTSLTVLGNWGGGGGRITIERTARFRFDAQWNYAWVQRLDDTGGVNISSVTSLASDSVVANCRVHFVSSLPSYYAGSSTLLVRRSCFSFSFFFFFFR